MLIHVLCGISGSGKSTRAKQLLVNYGGFHNAVIINRDKIREQIYGFTEQSIKDYYGLPDFNSMEKNVSDYEDSLIRFSLQKGKTVIVDATHLRVKFLKRFEKFGVPVVYELIECDFDTALERDSRRIRQVGSEVLKKQWESLKRLKEDFDFKPWYPTDFRAPNYDNNKPDCIVFDIDGTLALKCDRSPFDWSKVADDLPNKPVVDLYNLLRSHRENCGCLFNKSPILIICSGRDGICEQDTRTWLEYQGLDFDELYIRTPNDCRPDYIIKQEFWEQISAKYNILFMVDDREQVVDHARRLGFTVLQCDYGCF